MLVLGTLGLLACKPDEVGAPTSALSSSGTFVTIEPAPAHLRGRVALLAGARLYAAPRFSSTSWTLALPDPPLTAADDELPRARVMRVVGASGEFLALTNDLAEDLGGCGEPVAELDALRMLLFVPTAHLAPVLTRSLELVPLGDDGLLRVGAGARVGPPLREGGMPNAGEAAHWRTIDADGLRALVPVPDDAVGLAFDPRDAVALEPEAGQPIFRDAEGSYAYLIDEGDHAELSLRNACGEHRRPLRDPQELAGLRELAGAIAALDDESGDESDEDPSDASDPPREPWRLIPGSDMRWTDGNLAGEVLAPFAIAALGQDWEDRRCFSLGLGRELEVVDEQPPVVCVRPEQLEFVGDQMAGFDRDIEVEIGGTLRFGQPTVEGPWGPDVVRELLNDHHATIAECLRPLAERLDAAGLPYAGRWRLELEVDGQGRVRAADIVAATTSDERIEDCLRADTGTWLLPPGAGALVVDLEFGDPQVLADQLDESWDQPEPTSEPEPEPKPKSKPESKPKSKPGSKPKSKPEPESEPGRVMIIRDEDDAELEDLAPSE